MAGYANRLIMITFPELSEDDDQIWVRIRNPKTVPPAELRSGIKLDKDGEPESGDALHASYLVFARLIIDWHVYDGTSTEDDQPLLPRPATPDLVSKLPLEIINRLGDELAKLNPQKPTEPQEASTSTT